MAKVNGCEVVRNQGRGYRSWSVYTPAGEHFAELDCHVQVTYSREEAHEVARSEARAACPADCECREEE